MPDRIDQFLLADDLTSATAEQLERAGSPLLQTTLIVPVAQDRLGRIEAPATYLIVLNHA